MFSQEKAKNLAYRDEIAIKNKFQVLKYVKKQPSDPNCPPLVARAKNLHKSIERNKILDNEIDAGSVSEAIAAKPLNAVNELASDAACLESRTVQTEDCTLNISSTLHSQQTEIRLPTLTGKKSTSLEQIPQTLSAKIYDDNQEFSKDNSSSDLTSAKKRQKLESLDQLDHNPDFFQLFLIESSKREERREEREARREEERRNEVKEQRDREERRAEKELEREERREERQRHHELLIASLLVKALGSRMDL